MIRYGEHLSSAGRGGDIPLSEPKNVTFEEVLQLPFRGSDYTISYGEELSQFGRLWLPEGNNKGTVIFIHGGCWMKKNMTSSTLKRFQPPLPQLAMQFGR